MCDVPGSRLGAAAGDLLDRGDFVFDEAGQEEAAEPTDEELAGEALALVSTGMPTREAADRLAARFRVSRRRAYDAVIAQRSAR